MRSFSVSKTEARCTPPTWPSRLGRGSIGTKAKRRRKAKSSKAIERSAVFSVPKMLRLGGTPNSS
jgi:hypothetical protein